MDHVEKQRLTPWNKREPLRETKDQVDSGRSMVIKEDLMAIAMSRWEDNHQILLVTWGQSTC